MAVRIPDKRQLPMLASCCGVLCFVLAQGIRALAAHVDRFKRLYEYQGVPGRVWTVQSHVLQEEVRCDLLLRDLGAPYLLKLSRPGRVSADRCLVHILSHPLLCSREGLHRLNLQDSGWLGLLVQGQCGGLLGTLSGGRHCQHSIEPSPSSLHESDTYYTRGGP